MSSTGAVNLSQLKTSLTRVGTEIGEVASSAAAAIEEAEEAMTGATASTAGAKGQVPAPAAGDQSKFLRGDGTWATGAGSVTCNHTVYFLNPTTQAYDIALPAVE